MMDLFDPDDTMLTEALVALALLLAVVMLAYAWC